MAAIKVHGGTRSGQSLCHTCVNVLVRKGPALGQEHVICQATHPNNRITWVVVECTDYRDKTLPSLRDMIEIATHINADRKTGKVGFVAPDKVEDDDKWKGVNNPFDY